MDTAWYPSGWGVHDNNDDWIAYEFSIAVRIHAVKMVIDESHRTAAPQKIYVEASEKRFGPYVKKWTIHNPTYDVNRMYRFLGVLLYSSKTFNEYHSVASPILVLY